MKKMILFAVTIAFIFSGCSKNDQKTEAEISPAQKEKVGKFAADIEVISYRMGFDTSVSAFRSFPEMDPEAVCRGVRDAAVKPVEPKYSDDVFNRSMAKIRHNKVKIDAGKRFVEYKKNQPISEKYMEEAAKKKGIVKLEKGVLLEELKKGEGNKVTMDDTVEINYQGWDALGKLFDSSYMRERSSKFKLNDLIEGLKIGMLEMQKGGKYNVYIPEDVGYGLSGHKNRVEGGMALLFEVEVIDFKKRDKDEPDKKEKKTPKKPSKKFKNKKGLKKDAKKR
ncbi:MAG: FKBP-type peptidyl-prolyl cis-trans isomerase [bacterium]